MTNMVNVWCSKLKCKRQQALLPISLNNLVFTIENKDKNVVRALKLGVVDNVSGRVVTSFFFFGHENSNLETCLF